MNDYKIYIIPLLSDNYSFIFQCNHSKISACIDPADGPAIASFLKSKEINLDFILNTHHHYDHIGGNQYLKELYKCKIIGYEDDKTRIPLIDIPLTNNDSCKIGKHIFHIKHIPGHTTGHICYLNNEHKILFAGDTLFSSGCGRLFEGTYEQMYNSLEQLKNLPKATKVYCAHEYTINNIKFALTLEPNNQELLKKYKLCTKLLKEGLPTIPTTIKNELETNPFLRTLSTELRKSINKTSDSYNIEIFKHIRKLKDRY